MTAAWMELTSFDERRYNFHMFLMPDSFLQKQKSVHHLNIRNFYSCDVICGTEVLYSIIRDSDLIYIFKEQSKRL